MEAFVHGLTDLKRGFDPQGEARDDAQGSQSHHHALEAVVPFARREDAAVSGDHFQARHSGGQIAVGITRAMRRRRYRPGDRDMGEGSQVMQRKALPVKFSGQGSVPRPAADRNGHVQRVHGNAFDHAVEDRQRSPGVRDVVERMAGSQRPDTVCTQDELLQLPQAGGMGNHGS